MSIESELRALMRADGLIVVEDVHDWAFNHHSSDIHKSLAWDDKIAGREYRYSQIRGLIRVHVRFEDQPDLRQFVSLTTDRVNRNGGGYRDINAVLRSQSLHEVLLADALQELERIERKYQSLKALKPIWAEAAKVRQRQQRRSQNRKRGDERRI